MVILEIKKPTAIEHLNRYKFHTPSKVMLPVALESVEMARSEAIEEILDKAIEEIEKEFKHEWKTVRRVMEIIEKLKTKNNE
jgi:lipopolysaccharide biosynthesis regulator YciM